MDGAEHSHATAAAIANQNIHRETWGLPRSLLLIRSFEMLVMKEEEKFHLAGGTRPVSAW